MIQTNLLMGKLDKLQLPERNSRVNIYRKIQSTCTCQFCMYIGWRS